jgi:uncharacterized protein (DUF302 family)
MKLLAILALMLLAATSLVAEQTSDSMKYIVTTSKSVEDATAAVEKAAKENKFGVLHIHDIQATLKKKGIEFPNGCKVLEICNPQQAAKVLNEDMDLNFLLPCRISVYEKDGKTHIGMVRPTALLGAFSDAASLKEVAEEVEAASIKIIDSAK